MQKLTLIVFLILLSGWSIGCGTTQEHRIRQYPREFAAMSPDTQEKIREAQVEAGFSPLQVYLALGPPNGSARYSPPTVQSSDQWTYLGRPREEGFQTSYDWAVLPNQDLHHLVITFGKSGVAQIRLVPIGKTDSKSH